MEESAQYFKSYEELDVHRLMLNDNPRMLGYKNAILNNRKLFQNKCVMDVGAGTGILSVFCAQAGARRVYAVEAAPKLSKLTTKIAEENDFASTIIVVNKPIEKILPDEIEKVDIIVSEWMGFYLVHEGMLDSVFDARDRFLKNDGLLFPCTATIIAAPCEIPEFFQFWDDVHGVKMKCFGHEMRRLKSANPEVTLIKEDNLLAEEKILAWIDLRTALVSDLNIIGGQDLVFPIQRAGKIGGICIWFNVEFPDNSTLSTAPYDEPTHWKQTAIVLPEVEDIEATEPVAFRVTLTRMSPKTRQYNLEVEILDPETTEHDMPCDCHMTKCIVLKEYMKDHDEKDMSVTDTE